MKWFIEQSKATPKHGTELNACVLYPEKEKATELPDEPPAGSKLVFVVTNVAIANTFAADFSVDLDKVTALSSTIIPPASWAPSD
ncbi:hypothetical protein ACJ41O_006109 [Fusarium nematophilum]